MLVIGLTGGIGTGKTQVAKVLEELGAVIINADLIGHEAYQSHTGTWRKIVEAFGEEVLAPGGEVDRKKLGAIVFKDPEALRRLNAIVHPRMYEMLRERIEKCRAQGRCVVVVEAAILLEANWTPLVNEVWVVTAPEEQIVQRLQARSSLDAEAVRARIRSQMPQSERVKHADVVINNDGSMAQLRTQVQQIWNNRVSALKECRQQR